MEDSESSSAVQVSGTVMIIALIVFILMIFIAFLLYISTKWFPWRSIEDFSPRLPRGSFISRRRRRRFLFVLDEDSSAVQRGLDPSILKSLPIIAFQIKDFEDGLECAVCLSEIEEGENARLLPNCSHGFHVKCIDMWFQSHSTCPLCRTLVSSAPPQPTGGSNSDEHRLSISENLTDRSTVEESTPANSPECATFPANVLIWGDESRVTTTRGNGGLRMDLDEGTSREGSSESSSRMDGVLPESTTETPMEQDTSRHAVPIHFRTLTRLLSWEKRMGNPTSSNTPRKGVMASLV